MLDKLVFSWRGALLGVLASLGAVGFAIPATAAPKVTGLTSCRPFPSQAITSPGHYRLDADISTHDRVCFDIGASDVTLDLNGHTITRERPGDGLAGIVASPGTAHDDIVGPGTVTGWATGIEALGEHVTVRGVTVTASSFAITTDGADNIVRDNVATGNELAGIFADHGAIRNKIIGNTARGNPVDLDDVHSNCGSNVWRDNDFHVANEDCIH